MNWRPVLLVALIAAMLASYGVLVHRSDQVPAETAAPVRPGYYLRDATVTETDATGAPRMKLHADRITQNPADDSIALDQVTLNYQSDAATRWLLTANQGHVAAGSRTIQLTSAVYIKPLDPASNPVELRTEALSIDTGNNIATAPGKVNIQMDQQHLTATGLKYDLKRQTLKLQSQVHGQFQPQ
jgi:LPS export ABC transporter protein LptC